MSATYRTIAPTGPPVAQPVQQLGRWTQTLHSDAYVPLAQAVIGGALISTTIIVAGCLLIYLSRTELAPVAPLLGAGWLLIGLVVSTALYFIQLRAVQRTWWSAELLANQDLDGDGQIGRPVETPAAHPFPVGAYQPERVRVEDEWHATAAWFVRRCFAEDKRGEKAHVGQPKPNGGRLSEAEYHDLVQTLIGARYAMWKDNANPRQGWIWRPGPTADQIVGGLARSRS